MRATGASGRAITLMASEAAAPATAGPAGARGILKQSLSIAGHRTSIALEQQFWSRLRTLATLRQLSVPRLIADIDARRADGCSLSSAIRVYLLEDALASRHADPA